METHSCFTILCLLGIRISQCGLTPISLIAPLLTHLIKLCHPIKIIDRLDCRMLFRRIIEQITHIGINIHKAVHSRPHKRQLRSRRILVKRFHLRMICNHIIRKLFYLLKRIDRPRNACFRRDITTVNASVSRVRRQQRRNCIQFAVDRCLLQRGFGVHCIVIRRIGRKQIIQCHKCASLCQVCKTKPACTICHIKLFTR